VIKDILLYKDLQRIAYSLDKSKTGRLFKLEIMKSAQKVLKKIIAGFTPGDNGRLAMELLYVLLYDVALSLKEISDSVVSEGGKQSFEDRRAQHAGLIVNENNVLRTIEDYKDALNKSWFSNEPSIKTSKDAVVKAINALKQYVDKMRQNGLVDKKSKEIMDEISEKIKNLGKTIPPNASTS